MKIFLPLLPLSCLFALGNAQQTPALTCGADTLNVDDQCLCDTDAACSAVSTTTTTTNTTTQDEAFDDGVVYLAGIFDVSNFAWGPMIFNFTVSLLNNKTNGWFDDVLPDTQIEFGIADAACNADDAVASYWELRPMHAVVGCRCSGASAAVARNAGYEGVPQISPVSTSTNLDAYSLFSRVVAPDDERGEVGAIINILNEFGWERVTILSTDVPYAKDISVNFRKLFGADNIAWSDTFSLNADGDIEPESVTAVLSSVPVNEPGSSSRVILLASHDQHSYTILKQAAEMGFPEDTIWVGLSWAGTRIPWDTSWIPPVPGYLGLVPFRNRDAVYQDYIGRLQEEQAAQGLMVWTEFEHYAVGYMVDSIVAMATALGSVSVDQRRNGTLVTAALRNLTLNGISGDLSFTDSGHRQNPRFTVVNMQQVADGQFEWVTVGSTGTQDGSTQVNLQAVCFAEAGCNLDQAPLATDPVPGEPFNWVVIVIPVIGLLLIAVAFKYRRSQQKKKILKESMSAMEKKMADMAKIDDELLDIDDQVERAKLKKDSLILKRSALQDKPAHWCDTDKTLVAVEPDDDQYWAVADRLQETMEDAHISKIWRVQNTSLWSYYSFHKDRLAMHGVQQNEQSVWHGTTNLDPSVIYNDRQDGFMMQFSQDGFWGRGIYFANKSNYSYGYSYKPTAGSGDRPRAKSDEREMFLAKLLVGNETHMNRDEDGRKAAECRALTVPPINPQTNLKYNTVTGHTGGSQVWIVYENGRAYPDYLVRYYRGKRDPKRTPFESKKKAMENSNRSNKTPKMPDTESATLSDSDSAGDLEMGVVGGQKPKQVVWEFLDNAGIWTPYAPSQQVRLEDAHLQLLINPKNKLAVVKMKSDEWAYEVDVQTMVQTNIQHPARTTRAVRRQEPMTFI